MRKRKKTKKLVNSISSVLCFLQIASSFFQVSQDSHWVPMLLGLHQNIEVRDRWVFISSRIFIEKQSSIHHTSALANSSPLIGKTSFLLLLSGGHQWQDMKKDQGSSQGQLGDMYGGRINYPWLVIFWDTLEKPICPFCIICYKKERINTPKMTNTYGTKGRNHRFTDCLWNCLIEDCELKAATH